MPPSGREIGAEIRNAIMRLAMRGHTRAEVARRLGVSFGTVDRYWPHRPKKHKNDENGPSLE